MASRLMRILRFPIPTIAGYFMGRLFSRGLKKELLGEVTDKFLELLLKGMSLFFCLCGGYRKNIKGFRGRYVLKTYDGIVSASIIFEDGDMKVQEEEIDDWDTRITFSDSETIRSFLLTSHQDLIDYILESKVESEGNNNNMYKFGFMAYDLAHRLGLQI